MINHSNFSCLVTDSFCSVFISVRKIPEALNHLHCWHKTSSKIQYSSSIPKPTWTWEKFFYRITHPTQKLCLPMEYFEKKLWNLTCTNVVIALVDRKFNSCKILQDSCKKVQFLQDSWMQWHSYKILARFLQETVLYHKKENLARFLQDSCKNLWSITRILQDLARNKPSVYTLCSDNLCISPKTQHNQPLQENFDELHNCWTHFVIEHL